MRAPSTQHASCLTQSPSFTAQPGMANRPTVLDDWKFTTVAAASVPICNLLAVSKDAELALALGGTHWANWKQSKACWQTRHLPEVPARSSFRRSVADWDNKRGLAAAHNVDGQSRLEYPIADSLSEQRVDQQYSFQSGWQRDRVHGSSRALGRSRDRLCSRHVRSGQNSDTRMGFRKRTSMALSRRRNLVHCNGRGCNLGVFAVNPSGKLRACSAFRWASRCRISHETRLLLTMNSKRLAMGYTAAGSREVSTSGTTTEIRA